MKFVFNQKNSKIWIFFNQKNDTECLDNLTGKNTIHDPGDREHATALYMACRHLPTPLLSSPGERAGMLVEAARTLERIGDKKRLQDCYTLMKAMGTSISTWFVALFSLYSVKIVVFISLSRDDGRYAADDSS